MIATKPSNFPENFNRVEGGEKIMTVNPDELHRHWAEMGLIDAEKVHELLSAAARMPLPIPKGLTVERAEQLIGEISAGREAGR